VTILSRFLVGGKVRCHNGAVDYERTRLPEFCTEQAVHLSRSSIRAQDAERFILRPRHELIGESLREIGILLLVFVPLDALIHDGVLSKFQIAVCLLLLIVGWWAISKGIRMEGG
jgi:hypothetical protein